MKIYYTEKPIPETGVTREFVEKYAKEYKPKEGDSNLPWQLKGQKWFEGFKTILNIPFYLHNVTQWDGEILIYKTSDSKVGFGVIALTDINENDIVFYYFGNVFKIEDYKKMPPRLTGFLSPGGMLVFDCDDFGACAGVVNHASTNLDFYKIDRSKVNESTIAKPNLISEDKEVTLANCNGRVSFTVFCLQALRKIKKYEVLLFDYGIVHFNTRNIIPKLFDEKGVLVNEEFYKIKEVEMVFSSRVYIKTAIGYKLPIEIFVNWKNGAEILNKISSFVIIRQSSIDDLIIFYSPQMGLHKLSVTKIKKKLFIPQLQYYIVIEDCKYEPSTNSSKVLGNTEKHTDKQNGELLKGGKDFGFFQKGCGVLMEDFEKQGNGAFEEAKRSLKIEPSSAVEKFTNAVVHFINAINLCEDPKHRSRLLCNLGHCYFLLKDFNSAIDNYGKALDCDYDNESAYKWITKAMEAVEKLQSIQQQESTNKVSPKQ